MILAVAVLYASFIFVSSVRAHPASPLAVAVVTEQFKNAKLVPDVIIEFKPIGLTSFNYTGVTNKTTVGAVLSAATTATSPRFVYIRGTAASEAAAGGPFNVTTTNYTLIMFDAGVPGYNATTYPLLWLANDWTYGENDDHTVTLEPPSSSVVAYTPPAPGSGTGPHRYVTLIYAQADNFTAPDTPAPGSTSVTSFDLSAYITSAGLTPAIAGTYFTVEEGTATVSVAATTAVDSKTLPEYTPTSTSPSPGATSNSANANAVSSLSMGALLLGLLWV